MYRTHHIANCVTVHLQYTLIWIMITMGAHPECIYLINNILVDLREVLKYHEGLTR